MSVVHVLRYAKPKPKKPVNEQGVPIRQRPLPGKPKRKTPSTTPETFDLISPEERNAPEPAAMRYPTPEGEPDPDYADQQTAGADWTQPAEEPPAPFDPNQPATFPAEELGWPGGGHGLAFLSPEEMNQRTTGQLDPSGEHASRGVSESYTPIEGARYMAESLEGAYPHHEAAAYALRAIQDAHAWHDPEGGVHRIRELSSNQLGDLPVGHVRSEKAVAGPDHYVIVHYPQGHAVVYRGRINE